MNSIDNYKFGKPYYDNIQVEDADKFAKIFGDGSTSLTELIKFFIINNIPTIASCKGHPEKRNFIEKKSETGYITFIFNENYDKDKLAYILASLPLVNKHITSYIENVPPSGKTVTLYVPSKLDKMSDIYFEYILNILKEYKINNNKDLYINSDVIKMVDYTFIISNNISFEITSKGYKKYVREGIYIKRIAKCPASKNTKLLHHRIGYNINHFDNVVDFIYKYTGKERD